MKYKRKSIYMGVKSFGEIVNNHNLTNLEHIVIIWENFIIIVHWSFAKKLHALKRIMPGLVTNTDNDIQIIKKKYLGLFSQPKGCDDFEGREFSCPGTPFPELFSGPWAPRAGGERGHTLDRNPRETVFVAARNIVWWCKSLAMFLI